MKGLAGLGTLEDCLDGTQVTMHFIIPERGQPEDVAFKVLFNTTTRSINFMITFRILRHIKGSKSFGNLGGLLT